MCVLPSILITVNSPNPTALKKAIHGASPRIGDPITQEFGNLLGSGLTAMLLLSSEITVATAVQAAAFATRGFV